MNGIEHEDQHYDRQASDYMDELYGGEPETSTEPQMSPCEMVLDNLDHVKKALILSNKVHAGGDDMCLAGALILLDTAIKVISESWEE